MLSQSIRRLRLFSNGELNQLCKSCSNEDIISLTERNPIFWMFDKIQSLNIPVQLRKLGRLQKATKKEIERLFFGDSKYNRHC